MKTLLVSLAAAVIVPAAAASEISITYSAEFQEKLESDYGAKEGDRLSKEIRSDLERELRKANVDPARISVIIVDAKPNRPTMQQMSDEPGLDMLRSKSIGGMDLEGTAYNASGEAVAELQYDWYETNIQMVGATGVWGDAKRASSRFAKKFAEKLSE
ncbi:hypothetical protein D1227_05030 [Henriciella mobilis]|uniref:hypothetical protein n=1 Tax=Henriciella mobilis TaxID=2305467 RepID=UPI000E66AC7E|nr:hypothetical protein [Henriciella mobilis]RIJ16215.1 hypothetical protein D1231_10570 [Henriciella mobilis]RIJ22877.1 hypothetical protein D1227_05030 [Henriciella mobilis]